MKYDIIITNSNLPTLKIDIYYPQNKILKKLKNIKKKNFFNKKGNKPWITMVLRGLSFDKFRQCFEYGFKKEEDVPYIQTEITKKCTKTLSFFKIYSKITKNLGVLIYQFLIIKYL